MQVQPSGYNSDPSLAITATDRTLHEAFPAGRRAARYLSDVGQLCDAIASARRRSGSSAQPAAAEVVRTLGRAWRPIKGKRSPLGSCQDQSAQNPDLLNPLPGAGSAALASKGAGGHRSAKIPAARRVGLLGACHVCRRPPWCGSTEAWDDCKSGCPPRRTPLAATLGAHLL